MGFLGFELFQVMFFVVFLIVIAFIIFVITANISNIRKNKKSPRITVPAVMVTKRTQYRAVNRATGMHTTGMNHYFATFELENGDRFELSMPPDMYGLLAEGDRGKLTFQGTCFLSFDRDTEQKDAL